MPANTDPAAVADMARRREQLDEAQQLKERECQARKALKRMMDEHGHDCDCGIPRVLCEYCEGRAALSAPCPCEELRRELERVCELVKLTDIAALIAERASLRAENEGLKRSIDWITAEKHGAQADAEREKNVVDSLRAELAAIEAAVGFYGNAGELAGVVRAIIAKRDELRAELTNVKAEADRSNKIANAFIAKDLDSSEVARAELAASQERERVLREELARALNNNHQRNLELDALHYVWCDGGCGGGVHRFGPNPPLTAEIVEAAARNAERLRRWLLNNEYRKKVAATPEGTEKP